MRTELIDQRASSNGTSSPPTSAPVTFSNRRLRREHKTFVAMAQIYCADHHGCTNGLCGECQGLMAYAAVRLQRCRFGEEKPTCAKCPVHCYRAERRDQAKAVMRYAGPRMLWRHPILCFYHFVDGFRKAPVLTANARCA